MIRFEHRGSFKNAKRLFRNGMAFKIEPVLDHYGQEGVDALAAATPKRSGRTAASWSYSIDESGKGTNLNFNNSHVEKGWANIAILLQYGHGTGTGGYVPGEDYINPAIQPVFDKIADEAWEKVVNNKR